MTCPSCAGRGEDGTPAHVECPHCDGSGLSGPTSTAPAPRPLAVEGAALREAALLDDERRMRRHDLEPDDDGPNPLEYERESEGRP